MAEIVTPAPVKLIVGMLSARADLLGRAVERLEGAYGPVDVTGEVMEFGFTDYYERQMGKGLLRQFVAFGRLIDPGEIGPIKIATNAMEAEFAATDAPPPRPVNLDPGYVTESKLVLASTKDFSHRIYLGGGIFAEVTLTYSHGRWTGHQWTFPDYASGAYDAFLDAARRKLRSQLGRKERRE
ncbi:MAG TPA: DUF4416 family protein [Phycisphaerae bacterium]|nr:DUF4416 family protein [Phycisphaerae bacterium]